MAICRCKKHPPKGRRYSYTHFAKPIGYPNTSSICGLPNCVEPGLIFLSDDFEHEVTQYRTGQRIFRYPSSNENKVKVKDFLYNIDELDNI